MIYQALGALHWKYTERVVLQIIFLEEIACDSKRGPKCGERKKWNIFKLVGREISKRAEAMSTAGAYFTEYARVVSRYFYPFYCYRVPD